MGGMKRISQAGKALEGRIAVAQRWYTTQLEIAFHKGRQGTVFHTFPTPFPHTLSCHPHQRWFVASSIFGATNMEQLKANISAFDKELTPECLADIAEVYKKYRDPTF